MTHALPAWCTRLVGEYTAADARAETLGRALTRAQLNWRPRPDAWSIGQCLEHLAAANELYLEEIEAALTRNLSTGPVQDVTPGPFTRYFIREYMEPSTGTKRARAPAGFAHRPTSMPASSIAFSAATNARARSCAARPTTTSTAFASETLSCP
jgi:hypothetical protein